MCILKIHKRIWKSLYCVFMHIFHKVPTLWDLGFVRAPGRRSLCRWWPPTSERPCVGAILVKWCDDCSLERRPCCVRRGWMTHVTLRFMRNNVLVCTGVNKSFSVRRAPVKPLRQSGEQLQRRVSVSETQWTALTRSCKCDIKSNKLYMVYQWNCFLMSQIFTSPTLPI